MIEKDRDDQHHLKSSTNTCNSQYTLVFMYVMFNQMGTSSSSDEAHLCAG